MSGIIHEQKDIELKLISTIISNTGKCNGENTCKSSVGSLNLQSPGKKLGTAVVYVALELMVRSLGLANLLK